VHLLNNILIFAPTKQDDVQLSKTSIANFKMKRMKKNVIVVGLLCLSLTAFYSCKDKKDKEVMSDLTVEEHKENLQDQGIAFMNDMSAMENMSSIQIIQDFANLEVSEDEMTAPVLSILNPLTAIKSNSASTLKLKSLSTDSETLSGLFADNAGIYTYNAETLSWDKVESTEEITFNFPAGSSTTNNATISFTDFEVIDSPNADNSSAELSELVKSLKVVISKNNVPQMSFAMSASYNSDGLPENSNIAFTFAEGYTFTTTTALTSKIASFDQSFTYNTKQLYASHLEFNGDINYDAIINATEEDTDTYDQALLKSANAWFSINNIKFQGVADIKGFNSDLENINANGSEETVMTKVAAAYNNNLKFYIKYKDSEDIIAKNEFYAVEITDDWGNSYWDVDQRIIFSDKSAMDETTFFDSGFDNLQSAIEEWANAMDTNYGE